MLRVIFVCGCLAIQINRISVAMLPWTTFRVGFGDVISLSIVTLAELVFENSKGLLSVIS